MERQGEQVVAGLLLDLDDTLVDTRTAVHVAARTGFAAVCPDIATHLHAAAAERFCLDPEGYLGEYTAGRITFADQRSGRFRDTLLALGLDRCCGRADSGLTPQEHSVFEDRFGAAMRATMRTHPDALGLLRRAHDHGVPVGVVTNSSTSATRMKLDVTGLADHVDVVVTTDTLGFGKPDPRIFHHACDLLGSAPADVAFVGDDLGADAIGARDAGLRSHWLVRDAGGSGAPVSRTPRGVRQVSSLDDVVLFRTADLGEHEPAR